MHEHTHTHTHPHTDNMLQSNLNQMTHTNEMKRSTPRTSQTTLSNIDWMFASESN